MSFDLVFLPQADEAAYAAAMEAEEAADDHPVSDAERRLWDQVAERLLAELPGSTIMCGERYCQFVHEDTAIQVSLAGGQLTATVPYWYDGPNAERVVGLLRRAAQAIEEVTGLVAYDPQASAPFSVGAADAPQRFSEARRVLSRFRRGR